MPEDGTDCDQEPDTSARSHTRDFRALERSETGKMLKGKYALNSYQLQSAAPRRTSG